MSANEIIIIAICSFTAIISSIALIVALKSNKKDTSEENAMISSKLSDMAKNISDEFSRSRTEQASREMAMRQETTKSLTDMALKLESMTKANFEHRITLNETISSSLNMIRDKTVEQSERQTKLVEQSISKMQESNEKKLDEMRATVDEKLTSTLTTRLDSSFKTVSDQLENLYKSLGEMKELSSGVTDNVTTLNRVLTNVKARGTWAEVQLGGILDQTIPNMYETNFATDKDSKQRVEFAIKIPSNGDASEMTYLPVDSKFPMEDYIRLCDAADIADGDGVKTARKALEDRILKEAREITKYINIPKTTPFAIMYLATEGLYAEIASSRTGLPERLQSEFNIMIAGPTTITALLNSLSMGFKTVAINEKANEVRKLLEAAKGQYDIFGVLLEKTRKKIDEAGRTIDDAQNRNRIIKKKLKSIGDVEIGEANTVLGLESDNAFSDVDE
ncbi:MAG: DNA recombination protein RmuC [Oscillospiraceae bacterium]